MNADAHELTPLVSVIMCVRNGEHLVEQQLRALAQQHTQFVWELVVVDNGSTDRTVAVVQQFATIFPVPLRIIDASARAGICHARNVGASAAKGELLAFCDCDDAVDQRWVEAAAVGLSRYDLLAGALQELNDKPEASPIEGGSYIAATFGGAVTGCNFAVRRNGFFSIGGFDESLPPYGCDDVEFSLRANEAGLLVGHSEDMIVRFRRTTSWREVLRKTYLSSQAEALVWFRHSDRYGDRVRPVSLLLGVLAIVPSSFRAIVDGGSRRTLARQAVTKVGHAVGYWNLVRRDAGSPLLVFQPVPTHQITASGATP